MVDDEGFVDAVLVSPLGVSWLAVLEAGGLCAQGWPTTSPVSDPSAVSAAVARVGEMSFGSLMQAAVFAGVMESGPWIPDAPAKIAAAYQQAESRAPIAEAISMRFGNDLHAPLDINAQQWFSDGSPGISALAPLFAHFDDIYGAGEFTHAGLWTASDPPAETTEEMAGAWEYETGPIMRWWLPVRPEARVVEIQRPQDWANIVTAHPRVGVPHPGWKLPGVNQRHAEIAKCWR